MRAFLVFLGLSLVGVMFFNPASIAQQWWAKKHRTELSLNTPEGYSQPEKIRKTEWNEKLLQTLSPEAEANAADSDFSNQPNAQVSTLPDQQISGLPVPSPESETSSLQTLHEQQNSALASLSRPHKVKKSHKRKGHKKHARHGKRHKKHRHAHHGHKKSHTL